MSLLLTAATTATTTASTTATTLAKAANTATTLAKSAASTATSLATTSTTVSATAGTAKSVSAASLLTQMVVGLGVVIGLIWLVSKVLKGRAPGMAAKRRNQPLAILGRQPLGKGVQLAIVKAGAETYLLGITAHQVTNLARFEPEDLGLESPDDLPPAVGTSPGSPSPAPFRFQSPLRALQDRTVRKH